MLYTQITSLRPWQPTPMHGVTFIEMIVVLVIVAIVTTMAVPTFNRTITRMRITSYTNELLAYLSFARSEAVMRGKRVIVCKSKNGSMCTTNGGWEQGFIIFVDNATHTQANAGELLRVHEKLEGNITIQGDTPVSDYVSYSSDGRTRLNSNGFQAGTLSICNINSGLRSAIRISSVGRARSDNNCKFCPASDPEDTDSLCSKCTADCS